MDPVTTLYFDFVNDRDAIEFVRRVTTTWRTPCLRDGRVVMTLVLPDEQYGVEEVAQVLHGILIEAKVPSNYPQKP